VSGERVVRLPPARIDICANCGKRCDSSNRTVDPNGRIVHGGKGRGCPSRKRRKRKGAAR
jgi:hypothetical protein